MTFRDGKDDLTDKIDFIICLGGDGTLLYASLLFQVIIGCLTPRRRHDQNVCQTPCAMFATL